jgi:hypothetical protein
MSDDLTSDPEFLQAVFALRRLHPQVRLLALHAALFWTNAELVERGTSFPIDDDERVTICN